MRNFVKLLNHWLLRNTNNVSFLPAVLPKARGCQKFFRKFQEKYQLRDEEVRLIVKIAHHAGKYGRKEIFWAVTD